VSEGDEKSRGVANPHVVDLIQKVEDPHRVELLLFEQRAWDDVPTQLRQLEEKLNNYIEYIMGGHLVKQYPQYEKLPIEIVFHYLEPLGALQEDFVSQLEHTLTTLGIGFQHRTLEKEELQDEQFSNLKQ